MSIDPSPPPPGERHRIRVALPGVSGTLLARVAEAVAGDPAIVVVDEASDRELDIALEGDGEPSARPAVVLGEWPEQPSVERGVAGAFLYLDATAEELLAAVHAVAAGLFVMDPGLAGHGEVNTDNGATSLAPSMGERLTEREREVLELMAAGLPNKAIARQLGISEHTAKYHVGAILSKLDAQSRAEAVMLAARRGWLAL